MGIELDGEMLRTRAASAEYEKLRLALHWVLEQRRVSGHEACDLHIFGASASLIRVCGCVSCQAELKHFLSAMPLLESDWSLPWTGTVMATDACEDGYGVASGKFPPSVVSSWERRLERHRFRFMSAVQGRKHALAVLDPFCAAEMVEDLSGECEVRHVVDGSFEEVSQPTLRKTTGLFFF